MCMGVWHEVGSQTELSQFNKILIKKFNNRLTDMRALCDMNNTINTIECVHDKASQCHIQSDML